MSTPDPTRLPRQIPYIIASEGCERFSFYGMRNILTTFLAGAFFANLGAEAVQGEAGSFRMFAALPSKAAEAAAKDVFHTFVAGVYFFPLLGGWLSDRFFGKYRTILWVSLLYCLGHGFLAKFEDNQNGFYAGLFMIAVGSGGIKPLVSSFVGDQFDQHNKHRAKVVFDAFYWSINFGSFFASLLMPKLLDGWGPAMWWDLSPASVAFGVPGILMLLATLVFWLARKRYVRVPPAPPDPDSFLRVIWTALTRKQAGEGSPGLVIAIIGLVLALGSLSLLYWAPSLKLVKPICIALLFLLLGGGIGAWIQLERARGVHPDEAVDGVRSVLRVLVIFALVTPFWSLFDQKASTWVFQAKNMETPSWIGPPQMQALNPALVMLLIPLNNLVLFPLLRRRGFEISQLWRMGLGIALAGCSWIAAGALQLVLDARYEVSIFWQLLPYVLLTLGEVLVSATGLEFAYSQAPKSMKGAIMAFWSLAVTFGNVWVLIVDETVKRPAVTDLIAKTGISLTAFLMFFFAAFALSAAFAFSRVARRYQMVDYYRQA